MTDYKDEGIESTAIQHDEQLLSRLGGFAASGYVDGSLDAAFEALVADHDDDPAATALAALAADVSGGASLSGAASGLGSSFPASPQVVDLRAAQRRRNRHLRRSAVAGAAAVVALSMSGVAAAGTLAAHRGEPLHSVYTFFHGRSASDKAAGNVDHFEDLAAGDLAADPQRLVAAAAALSNASDWLLRVNPSDLGNLPDRLIDLKSDLAAATRAADGVEDQGGDGQGSDQHGADDGSGDHSQGQSREGSDGPSGHGDGPGTGGELGGDGSSGGPGSGSDDGSAGSSTSGSSGTGSSGDTTGSSGSGSSGGTDGGSTGGSDGGSSGGSGDGTSSGTGSSSSGSGSDG